MFAQTHHAAMRHVAPVRVELGTRTIFNLLGPLVESGRRQAPASRRLLRGSGSSRSTQVLKELGSERVWTVHGSDGLDEMTTTGPTHRGGAGERRDPPLHRDARGGRPADARNSRTSRAAIRSTTRRSCAPCWTAHARPIATSRCSTRLPSLVIADEARDLRDGLDRASRALDQRRREGDARPSRQSLERLSGDAA